MPASPETDSAEPSLKLKTARTLKWNTIDRLSSQLVYAVVGIVLANKVSPEDFGLVGVLLIFQAFATILTDGGFGMALLQKKEATQADYSTVFWFNLAFSAAIYCALWFAAPLIADTFQGETRLIGLSRVMFAAFVLNGLSIVQNTRLMKSMDVRMAAIANVAGLMTGGIAGTLLAIYEFGAWALVWQSVTAAAVKTAILWGTSRWRPSFEFDFKSLKSILPVGSSVLLNQILNTTCLKIYIYVTGAFYSLRAAGIYTVADKWSTMGSAAITQILTSSFIPLLSKFSNEPETHRRYIRRINRFTALLTFPALIGLAAVGEPLFHTLFGHKWDAAIILFQILSIRGIFVVLTQLYYNYTVSLGRSRAMIAIETAKDALVFIAIPATIFSGSLEVLVWGQAAASLITFVIALTITSKATNYETVRMLKDLVPFLAISVLSAAAAMLAGSLIASPMLMLSAEIAMGALAYIWMLKTLRIPELPEMASYLLGRFRKK